MYPLRVFFVLHFLARSMFESKGQQNGFEPTITLPTTVQCSSPSTARSLVPSASLYQGMFDSSADVVLPDRPSRPTCRAEVAEPVEDAPETPSLRSRWRGSRFGSLTRRSSSVSKVGAASHSSSTLGRKGSEPPDGLSASSKRLTISRPVLISKPASLCKLTLSSTQE